MTEQFDEQLSLFIDDEMSIEECEFFVRRLQRDDSARDRFARYQLIGSVLRGETASAQRGGPALSVGHSATAAGQRPDTGQTSRFASGFGLAAGIALVAVAGFSLIGNIGGESQTDGSGIDLASAGSLERLEVAAELFPGQTEETGIQYLIHHTGYSAGVPRTIMRSGFVAAPMTIPQPATVADPLE